MALFDAFGSKEETLHANANANANAARQAGRHKELPAFESESGPVLRPAPRPSGRGIGLM